MIVAESPYPTLSTFEGWGDDIALHLARAWAESTLRLVDEARANRARVSEAERDMPREFDEASYPPLQLAVRAVLTSECMLVLSASQLERWIARLYRARGRKKPAPLESLKHLRNAIEHAVEADFDEDNFVARPRPNDAKSRKHGVGALPNAVLSFGFDQVGLFGVIDSQELETIARQLLEDLAIERKEWHAEMLARWGELLSGGE